MFFDVKSAKYIEGYRIELDFEDGSSGVVNLSDYASPNNVFKSFLDIEYFKKFRVEFGTLIWGDGEVDIAPETLYAKATGKKIIYTSENNSVQP